MDFIKKLVSDINAKDDENSVFEKEKCELEYNVTNQEECIKKKINYSRCIWKKRKNMEANYKKTFLH